MRDAMQSGIIVPPVVLTRSHSKSRKVVFLTTRPSNNKNTPPSRPLFFHTNHRNGYNRIGNPSKLFQALPTLPKANLAACCSQPVPLATRPSPARIMISLRLDLSS